MLKSSKVHQENKLSYYFILLKWNVKYSIDLWITSEISTYWEGECSVLKFFTRAILTENWHYIATTYTFLISYSIVRWLMKSIFMRLLIPQSATCRNSLNIELIFNHKLTFTFSEILKLIKRHDSFIFKYWNE